MDWTVTILPRSDILGQSTLKTYTDDKCESDDITSF